MKILKRIGSLAPALMASLVLCMALAGCGGGETESENPIAGSWVLSEMQMGEKSYSLEDFAAAVRSDKTDEISILLDIDEEGGFTLHAGDAEEPVARGRYSAAEEDGEEGEASGGYLLTVDDGRQNVKAAIEEDRLVLHDASSTIESRMIFTKKQGGGQR